jgi:hypothetical protein
MVGKARLPFSALDEPLESVKPLQGNAHFRNPLR